MKNIALIAMGLMLALNASAQVKVATIDMEKVFNGYKKVQTVEKQIKAEIEKSANDLQKRQDEGAGLLKQLEELRKKQNNSALSNEAQTAAKKQAREIEDRLDQKQAEFEKLRAQSRKTINDKEKAQREKIFKEIQTAAKSVGKKQNATVILDTSAQSLAGFPTVIYAEPSYDITNAVLALLNTGL